MPAISSSATLGCPWGEYVALSSAVNADKPAKRCPAAPHLVKYMKQRVVVAWARDEAAPLPDGRSKLLQPRNALCTHTKMARAGSAGVAMGSAQVDARGGR